ncbi:hypothetical protein EVAR_31937_1 [Eumeta japonica]|uniref:Uncharacterized protein n=1 Tax=Eumeta variegata TaxID=151549 RepID=A0A4C1WQ20_EUMVA|nr:hypothetical protein EVAR_31937_1 [Eumeta japonica]
MKENSPFYVFVCLFVGISSERLNRSRCDFYDRETVIGSGIGFKSETESRIENRGRIRIESETGTKIENVTRVENECGYGTRIKSVTRSESKMRLRLNLTLIDKKENKIISVHADVTAGINYTGNSPTRKYSTTSAWPRCKRTGKPSESISSTPSMDTSPANIHQYVTGLLDRSRIPDGEGFIGRERSDVRGNGPQELSLTGRNITTKADT